MPEDDKIVSQEKAVRTSEAYREASGQADNEPDEGPDPIIEATGEDQGTEVEEKDKFENLPLINREYEQLKQDEWDAAKGRGEVGDEDQNQADAEAPQTEAAASEAETKNTSKTKAKV